MTYPFRTLPDHLARGLQLVCVGINPGLYSVGAGHYSARPGSCFWPASSRPLLSARIRIALGRDAEGMPPWPGHFFVQATTDRRVSAESRSSPNPLAKVRQHSLRLPSDGKHDIAGARQVVN